MIRVVKTIISVLTMVFLIACSGSTDNPGDEVSETPSKATLVFPDDNSECTEGRTVSDNESSINFQWETSANTDSYEVNVKNLDTGNSQKMNSNSNQTAITLSSNTPYEWFVVSKSNSSNETATSDTWKFYNAGAGVLNYAPFPADVINPEMGESIAATTSVNLQWQGNDVDNDIAEFEVLFGTTSQPASNIGTTAQSTFSATVTSGQRYYWRVITRDNAGNTSQSEIFEFRVQ